MGPGAGTGLGTHLVGTLHARFSNAEPQSRCALPNESAIGDNNRQSHLPDGAAARAPGAIRGRNSQPRDVDRRGPTVIVPAVAPDGDLPIGLSGPSTRKSRDTRSGLTILVEHGLDTLQVGILRRRSPRGGFNSDNPCRVAHPFGGSTGSRPCRASLPGSCHYLSRAAGRADRCEQATDTSTQARGERRLARPSEPDVGLNRATR